MVNTIDDPEDGSFDLPEDIFYALLNKAFYRKPRSTPSSLEDGVNSVGKKPKKKTQIQLIWDRLT